MYVLCSLVVAMGVGRVLTMQFDKHRKSAQSNNLAYGSNGIEHICIYPLDTFRFVNRKWPIAV